MSSDLSENRTNAKLLYLACKPLVPFVFSCYQGKRMNAKFLFFSNVYLLNKIILAIFRRIC